MRVVEVFVLGANSNTGSASMLGSGQSVRFSSFVYDYSRRRVPIPIVSYMAVASSAMSGSAEENPSKQALDLLRNRIEPAAIAEEELNSDYMRRFITESISEVNRALLSKGPATGMGISMTMVITDAKRAYIGHVGDTRIYILHKNHLYDLAPKLKGPFLEDSPDPAEPTLFGATPAPQPTDSPVPADQATPDASPQASQAAPAKYLGDSSTVTIGYNEVSLVPGDTLVLCDQGFTKSITEMELIESLTTASNIQRTASQLTKLAVSRDPESNATMIGWTYTDNADLPGTAAQAASAVRAEKARQARGRAAERALMALLGAVLICIMALGFAFGWRIVDTFTRDSKQLASSKRAVEKAEKEKKKAEAEARKAEEEARKKAEANFPFEATIQGTGVRMREEASPRAALVGNMTDDQSVTVLAEENGSDSEKWYKVSGMVVNSAGARLESTGFVKAEFVERLKTSEKQ